MADPFVESLMAWKPFRFFVGPDKKEFTMHADLVANMSKPLNALVNGAMKEAREGEAYLPEVDEATFALFLRYAYKGDYEVAGLELSDRAETCLDCEQDLIRCNCDYCNSCCRMLCYCGIKETQSLFRDRLYGHALCDQEITTLKKFADGAFLTYQMLEFRTNNSDETFSEVLLAHARLYAMADYYDLRSLATLSKNKIHQTLALLGLQDDFWSGESTCVNAVCNLVDYVCRNTVDKKGSPDLLRALLYNYCAMNIRFLSEKERFLRLLQERGDFSAGIICEIAKRKVSCSCTD
ncbi:hypothetical protein PFICI_06044 [Pestalotiopsis fici W106-1]|uniref:BTB domain-containing protein n=1 Tax=Pestalotiopsis fici (strain W106-1 / CGMCC3.15140) TaxID=1229662 RepID=W3X6L2_PESFW|nr:uncharacterized protein PFICI_06044 [Pestalotiopsis fici W106-1]ETS81042.1 hypothetical protein PFICI_06044 [Pestalotiopsis fici W106-1]